MKSTHKKSQASMRNTVESRAIDHADRARVWRGFTTLELRELSREELEAIVIKHGNYGDFIAFRLGGPESLINRRLIYTPKTEVNA